MVSARSVIDKVDDIAANECVLAACSAYGLRMAVDSSERENYWVRTIGAPRLGDPRDGELHQFFGRLRDAFDLEPRDDDPDGEDAHYVRDPLLSGPIEEDGRLVWIFTYQPIEASEQ